MTWKVGVSRLKSWVYHVAYEPYAYARSENVARIFLCVLPRTARQVIIYYGDRYEATFSQSREMEFDGADCEWDYFVADLYSESKRLKYAFLIVTRETDFWYGESGIGKNSEDSGVFQVPYLCERDVFQVPEWVRDAIAYQIFPDRFAIGDSKNTSVSATLWSQQPTPQSVLGGDLAGIVSRLGELAELGVTLIYLTPIFKARSNHKYDTEDYFEIDVQFGTKEEFRGLIREAHTRGMRVVIDAVFNHCGQDFQPFQDAVKKGRASSYWSWFYIAGDHVDVDHVNYETFSNQVHTMPKLRVANPEVETYLLSVAEYWIKEFDIDGWRLDVANEIDHMFWRKFRQVVKAAKPDALIIGEVWHDSLPWLRGDQFDGVMNYVFRDSVLRFFIEGRDSARVFAERITRLLHRYPEQAVRSMFNLLGSHDTERILTLAQGDAKKVAKTLIFQFTFPGIPMVYYGDEVGMEGGADPDCRRGMMWDQNLQNRELQWVVRNLARLRHEEVALHGTRMHFRKSRKGQLIYERISDDGCTRVAVLFNRATTAHVLPADVDILFVYPQGALVFNRLAPDAVVIWREAHEEAGI